ncbi:MAG: ion transporter [Bacteroidales bacterium]|nr:ion transporter [Bacteroidales bacterium]
MPRTRKRRLADALFRFFTNDVVLSVAIILSTIFVFLSGYETPHNIFLYIDAFFTLFFLVEALVKIFCVSPAPGRETVGEKFKSYWFGRYENEKRRNKKKEKDEDLDDEERQIRKYRDKIYEKKIAKEKKRKKGFLRKYVFAFMFDGDKETNHWNQFDFIITLIALPSLLNFFQDVEIQTNLLLSLRALRVFRALRIAKAARIMRFIPDIEKLVFGIKSALKSCFVVMVGFVIFMLITSILSSSLFGDIVPQYFGNPGQSLYSTFRLFTIEGWFDIPDAIAAAGSHGMAVFAKIYFSIFLFIGGIIGVSLINSFFVDAMAEDNNEDVLIKLDEMEKMIKSLQEEKAQKEQQEEPKEETQEEPKE